VTSVQKASTREVTSRVRRSVDPTEAGYGDSEGMIQVDGVRVKAACWLASRAMITASRASGIAPEVRILQVLLTIEA
jgi:hypothetical protein